MSSLCGGCTLNNSHEVCIVCKNLKPLNCDSTLEKELLVVKRIDGCLFPNEDVFLAQLAKSCTGAGVIVELGTYLGKSTVSLGLGSNLGNKVKIFTFDSYESDSAMETNPGMMKTVQDNLRMAHVEHLVFTHLSKTDIPPMNFGQIVELLFIDADHEYPSTKKDFLAWEPKVIKGGKIIFHDTYDVVQGGVRFLGPLKVIKEFCYNNPKFKILGRFQSITVVEKLKT